MKQPKKKRSLYLSRNKISYESYGRNKLSKPGSITFIKSTIEKVLVPATCKRCGKEGMAFEDPNAPNQKYHFCVGCNQ